MDKINNQDPAMGRTANPAGLCTRYTDMSGNEVTLSSSTVRNYLTRGGGKATDEDIVLFLTLCRNAQLNPTLNEAYLVKYGTQPAQLVVSKEAYLKRADTCPSFEGYKSGIIVRHKDGTVEQVQGCFRLNDDELLGGWAEVHRSDRPYPYYKAVSFGEYNKGKAMWTEKPGTMIEKVALVQALREAFPRQLSTMYTTEEIETVPTTAQQQQQGAQVVDVVEDTVDVSAPPTENVLPPSDNKLFDDPGF